VRPVRKGQLVIPVPKVRKAISARKDRLDRPGRPARKVYRDRLALSATLAVQVRRDQLVKVIPGEGPG
jgi:hypothetical protein